MKHAFKSSVGAGKQKQEVARGCQEIKQIVEKVYSTQWIPQELIIVAYAFWKIWHREL